METANATELLRLRLPASHESVPTARQLLVWALRRGNGQELVDTAALCLTELLANAVNAVQIHSTAPRDEDLTVVVSRDEECVRIAVTDPVPELPVAREAGDWDENGRGLALLAALATAWGSVPLGEEKSVWCDLPSHQTAQPTIKRSPVCHQIHGSSASRW